MKKDNQEEKSTTESLEQIPEKFIIWMDEGLKSLIKNVFS